MAPTLLRPRERLSKDRFSVYFNALKPQHYDPNLNSARAANTHQSNGVRTISWNPLGNLVATGSSDRSIRVWNPEKPYVKFSTELKGHSAVVEKVAFNPVKDAELCSVSNDGVVKFWDVRTKSCVNEVKDLGGTFTLVWAPDGESLIVGNKDDVVHILSPTHTIPLASHKQPCETNNICFCWSGKKVFAPTSDGRTRILSYPDFQPLLHVNHRVEEGESSEFTLDGHTSSCITAELSPTGRWLATGGSDSMISLWDTSKWMCTKTVSSMVGPVRSISFTWDGSYVVGGSDEGHGLEVTHTESGEHAHSFKTAGACPVVAWAPTRYCLAYSDVGLLKIVGVDPDKK